MLQGGAQLDTTQFRRQPQPVFITSKTNRPVPKTPTIQRRIVGPPRLVPSAPGSFPSRLLNPTPTHNHRRAERLGASAT